MSAVVIDKAEEGSADATVEHTAYKILRGYSEPSQFPSYGLERVSLAGFVDCLADLNDWYSEISSAADDFVSGTLSRTDLLQTLQSQSQALKKVRKKNRQLESPQELTRIIRDMVNYVELHDRNAIMIYLPLLTGLLEERIMGIGHQIYCNHQGKTSAGLILAPRSERAEAFKHHLAQLQMLSAGIDSIKRKRVACFKRLEKVDSNSDNSPLNELLGANTALRACFCTAVGRVEHEWYPDSSGGECLPSIPLIDTELLYKAHVLLETLGEYLTEVKAAPPMLETLERISDIMVEEFSWQRWNVPGAWCSTVIRKERERISRMIESVKLPSSTELAKALGQSATKTFSEATGISEGSELLETLRQIQRVQEQRRSLTPQDGTFQLLRYDNYAAIAGHYLYPNPEVLEEMWQIQESRALPGDATGIRNGLLTPIGKNSLRALVHLNNARVFFLQCEGEMIGYYLACTNSNFFPPIMKKIEEEVQKKGLFEGKQLAYVALGITSPKAHYKMAKYAKGPYRLLHQAFTDSVRLSAREDEHYIALALCRVSAPPAASLRIHKRFGWQEVEGVILTEKEWTFDDKEVEVKYQLLSLDIT
jgi:hypothetical protein